MPCEYFLLIRRQRRPSLLAIDDGLSLAGQHAGCGSTVPDLNIAFSVLNFANHRNLTSLSPLYLLLWTECSSRRMIVELSTQHGYTALRSRLFVATKRSYLCLKMCAHHSSCNWPYFISAGCAVIGCSYGKLGRFTADGQLCHGCHQL